MFFQFLFVDHNFHSLTAQYIRGPNQEREIQISGHGQSFISRSAIPNCGKGMFKDSLRGSEKLPLSSARSRASKLVPMILIPYLCSFSASFRAVCPPNCTITPSGFSCLDDIVNMFPEYRFKIEFIGNIKISRNGFRIAVDHDGFITTFFCGQNPVYTRIIKFDSLSNPIWAGAQNNDLSFCLKRYFHFLKMPCHQ